MPDVSGLDASRTKTRLFIELATTIDDLRVSQRLRRHIVGEELIADVRGAEQGFDEGEFDPYCQHLLV